MTVTLPSVDRQNTAGKTWCVAVEAVAGGRDAGSKAAADAEPAQGAPIRSGKAAKRRAAGTSKQTTSAVVKPEPAAAAAAGPESAARSARSRKRAR